MNNSLTSFLKGFGFEIDNESAYALTELVLRYHRTDLRNNQPWATDDIHTLGKAIDYINTVEYEMGDL